MQSLSKRNRHKWDTEATARNTVAVNGLDEEEIAQIRKMIKILKMKHEK